VRVRVRVPPRDRLLALCTSDADAMTSQAEKEQRLGNCSSEAATPDSSTDGSDDTMAYRAVAATLGAVLGVAAIALIVRKWLQQQDNVQVSFGFPLASVSNSDGNMPQASNGQLDGELQVTCQASRVTLLSACAALPRGCGHWHRWHAVDVPKPPATLLPLFPRVLSALEPTFHTVTKPAVGAVGYTRLHWLGCQSGTKRRRWTKPRTRTLQVAPTAALHRPQQRLRWHVALRVSLRIKRE